MANVRRGRREASAIVDQLPFERVFNPFRPLEILGPEQIGRIDDTAMQVLEEIGMDFLHNGALSILKNAGAEVEPGTQRVRFPRELIRHHVAKAPSQFMLRARNPARDVGFGGNEIVYGMMASAPNCSDLAGGRRTGSWLDYTNLVKLGHGLNAVHMFGGYPVEPVDLPPATRHLDCLRAFIELTDKAAHAYSLGRTRVVDALEIIRIGHGLTTAELAAEPRVISVINTSSPLRLDGPMIEGMIELGKLGQCVVLTPFTLAGAMAPVTVIGALAQQHAEALAGIAFYQMIKPGAPSVYGGFTSNVDMKTGAPAFGTPEYFRSTLISGQLARHYNLPFRSSNVNAANSVDAQAAYETMMSLWAVTMGGANFVKHATGWLEGGLCCSFEKVVLDADLIQMIRQTMQALEVNDDTLGLDAMREVGPGGHFFGAAQTLKSFNHAFYAPMVSDWRNFENWEDAGGPTADVHAGRRAKQLLDAYAPPALDPAISEELDAFVGRRKSEGGARDA